MGQLTTLRARIILQVIGPPCPHIKGDAGDVDGVEGDRLFLDVPVYVRVIGVV